MEPPRQRACRQTCGRCQAAGSERRASAGVQARLESCCETSVPMTQWMSVEKKNKRSRAESPTGSELWESHRLCLRGH